MTTSLLNGLQNGAASMQNYGLGALGLGSTKGPVQDRYHTGDDHGWQKSSKGGKKGNVALSALTLLAFLFFLNILQNCLQDQMDDMKGKKGYYQQQPMQIQVPNINVPSVQIPANMMMGRTDVELRTLPAKGDTGDNSLEIDDFTIQQAEEKTYKNRNKRRRKLGRKRIGQGEAGLVQVATREENGNN